jgi:uncharacterized NAD(P)/FAD-binding protein YdhS
LLSSAAVQTPAVPAPAGSRVGTPTGTRSVVVVGGGASATAFLWSLVKHVSAQAALRAPDVLVFEPMSPCGPGVAYREDTEVALLNRPVSSMSVDYHDRGHFRRWLAHREPAVARGERTGSVFVSRPCFGRYLSEAFDRACAEIEDLGGSVEVVWRRADTVVPGPGGLLVHSGGSTYRARDVVLCLGSVPARDAYGLRGVPGYIHQPYPLRRLDQVVEGGSRVLVLGSGLTAIDVALTLGRRSDDVEVTLASRSGLLPDVRSELSAGDGAPGLVEEVRSTLAGRDRLDVSDLARLLQDELVRNGWTLRQALRPYLARFGGVDLLRHRLAAPEPAAAVQRCVVALTPWYSRLWRALDQANRHKFSHRYGRLFTCLRSPMPPATARRLVALHEAGALSFRTGIVDVHARPSRMRAVFGDGDTDHFDTEHFDVVVNATGQGIDVSHARPGSLVESLVQHGLAGPHPLGGLDVSPDTNEVLDSSANPVPGLHVVGDLSSGVHFHTSSMEYAATQAGKVAGHLVEHLSSSAEAMA